ncbi:hypothetical protein [Flavobacterium oreochromis]|uniref:Uncharacterized protein n=1 Tax=Flavobacterium columnare TaxID=996 RepID=A0A246G933_9FLAO|nr:hypothetical protein [Flavobacterium oreochromis]OWP75860.1 hypothetical protein BWK62_10905 [Flavobacterium oreochromis]
MSKGKIYIINKRIILDFKMCISEYFVLMLIVKSERKFKTMHKGTRVRYSEIKGIDIANELLINPSNVSRNINKLKKKYCIDKTKFGYCVAEHIESYFNDVSKSDCILFYNDVRLYEFCKTPEQILVAMYLWNEFYLKSRDLKKNEIYTNIPVHKDTVDNTLEHLNNNQTIRELKNKIVFLSKSKHVFYDVINESEMNY